MLGGFINVIMFASIAVTAMFFLFMPARRALVTAYCVMWMFLPIAAINLPGLGILKKPMVIGLGVLIAAALFCADMVFKKFRIRWYDLPVLVFGMVGPFVSGMFNGLGIEGGLYETSQMLFLWVVPYFAGRILLGDELGVEVLATGIFYAALIYAPLAWYEMFMSPQLHLNVYGYHQHKFQQTVRGWSYRPMIFMQHGLMTVMWLVAGALCGIWLLKHKLLRWKWGINPKLAVGFLFFTAAVANSMGAVLLMIVGLAVLFATKLVDPRWLLVPLLLVAPIYIAGRSTGAIQSDDLVSLVEPISAGRASSLEFRMTSEDAYVAKASQRPVWGWGGHGREKPYDERGRAIGAPDGLWIIALGKYGFVGLVAMTLTLLLVPALVIFNQSRGVLQSRRFAPTAVLLVLLLLYAVDNLLNAMVNPIYMLAMGALASYATQPLGRRVKVRRRKSVPTGKPERPVLTYDAGARRRSVSSTP